jgi:subtilisin family serine protease
LHAQLVDAMLTETNGRVLTQAAGNERSTKFHLGYPLSADTQFTWFTYNAVFGDVYFQLWADQHNWDNANFRIGCYDPAAVSDLAFSAFMNIQDDFNLVDGGAAQQLSLYSVEIQVLPADDAHWWSFETTGSGYFDTWNKPILTNSSSMVKPPLLPDALQYPRIDHYGMPDTLITIVSSWACSDKVITVANYCNRNGYYDVDSVYRNFPEQHEELAISSSTGPTRDGRQKPDVTASGQGTLTSGNADVVATFLSNSNRYKVGWGGMHNTNGGTSMASPIVAGACALYLEKNPTANWQEVQLAIEQTARMDTYTGAVPNYSWGYGKLDAFNALTAASITLGCTDPAAFNYNAAANVDDGSCIPVITGCTDSLAVNFDPLANTEDGSCVYDTADTNIVIALIDKRLDAFLFPNPATDFVFGECERCALPYQLTVLDVLGRALEHYVVHQADFGLQVGNLQPGVYHLLLEAGDQRTAIPLLKE